jgi:hypothetical protein
VELLSKEVAELHHLQKLVKEGDTAKVRQARMSTGDLAIFAVIGALRAYRTKCSVTAQKLQLAQTPIRRAFQAILL